VSGRDSNPRLRDHPRHHVGRRWAAGRRRCDRAARRPAPLLVQTARPRREAATKPISDTACNTCRVYDALQVGAPLHRCLDLLAGRQTAGKRGAQVVDARFAARHEVNAGELLGAREDRRRLDQIHHHSAAAGDPPRPGGSGSVRTQKSRRPVDVYSSSASSRRR